MIIVSTNTPVTIPEGGAVTFDTTDLKYGDTECHRRNTTSVKLTSGGLYDLFFSATVSGSTANTTIGLSLYMGGEEIVNTRTSSDVYEANVMRTISNAYTVMNCCKDYDRITLVNTGSQPINIERAVLRISKHCGC